MKKKKKKTVPYRVENILRKGDITCHKQFLRFSHNVFQSYISQACQNAAFCGNGLIIILGVNEKSPPYYQGD